MRREALDELEGAIIERLRKQKPPNKVRIVGLEKASPVCVALLHEPDDPHEQEAQKIIGEEFTKWLGRRRPKEMTHEEIAEYSPFE